MLIFLSNVEVDGTDCVVEVRTEPDTTETRARRATFTARIDVRLREVNALVA